MTSMESRPYESRTDGELFLISESLEREIKTLTEKNRALQAEMRLRDGSKGSVAAILAYERAEALSDGPGGIGDLYANRSRRYSVQVSLIAIAIAVAIFIAIVMLG